MNENRALTLKLFGFAAGAFAFGFALVPLYDVMCEVTGFGNQKRLVEQSQVTGPAGTAGGATGATAHASSARMRTAR